MTFNQGVPRSSRGWVTNFGEVSEWFKELVLKTSDSERDRGFESHPLRHYRGVAQFGSASGLGPEGRGFKSCHPDHFAQIAQSVEQGTENPRVGGSIPPLGTTIWK